MTLFYCLLFLLRTLNFIRLLIFVGQIEEICSKEGTNLYNILAYFFLRNFLLCLFLCQTAIIILNSIERKETNKKNAPSPNVEQLILSD